MTKIFFIPIQWDNMNWIHVSKLNGQFKSVFSPPFFQFFVVSDSVQNNSSRECNIVVINHNTHQIKDSPEAHRRCLRIEMVIGDVALSFFKATQVVIGSVVIAFRLSSGWRALSGFKNDTF